MKFLMLSEYPYLTARLCRGSRITLKTTCYTSSLKPQKNLIALYPQNHLFADCWFSKLCFGESHSYMSSSPRIRTELKSGLDREMYEVKPWNTQPCNTWILSQSYLYTCLPVAQVANSSLPFCCFFPCGRRAVSALVLSLQLGRGNWGIEPQKTIRF